MVYQNTLEKRKKLNYIKQRKGINITEEIIELHNRKRIEKKQDQKLPL